MSRSWHQEMHVCMCEPSTPSTEKKAYVGAKKQTKLQFKYNVDYQRLQGVGGMEVVWIEKKKRDLGGRCGSLTLTNSLT